MSGRGAPAFTDAPRPASPNGVLVPSTIFPFFIRSSTCSGPLARRSAGAFDCSFCSSDDPDSNVTVTLFLVAFSNPAASSKTPVDGPMVVIIHSSAASPAPPEPARARRPTAAPKARALPHAFMASSLCPQPVAAIVGMQPIRSCGREPVASRSRQEPVIFPRLWCSTLTDKVSTFSSPIGGGKRALGILKLHILKQARGWPSVLLSIPQHKCLSINASGTAAHAVHGGSFAFVGIGCIEFTLHQKK